MKRRNKKNFNLRKNYRKSFNYIKESRNFIYTIIGIFLIFALIGFFVPAPEQLAEQIMEFIEELINQIEGMSQMELINFIFFNNLQSSFFGMIFGVVVGIFPVVAALANGYLIGFVAAMSVNEFGILSLWRILPHGIFELPAIFISLGLGLKLGTFIFQKKKIKFLKEYLWNSIKVFLFVVLPLLIIAAVIEGTLIFLGS